MPTVNVAELVVGWRGVIGGVGRQVGFINRVGKTIGCGGRGDEGWLGPDRCRRVVPSACMRQGPEANDSFN